MSEAPNELRDLPSASGDTQAAPRKIARAGGLDWVSRSVMRLDIELSEPMEFPFDAGQYVRIRAPETVSWRSYSMASTEKDLPRMRFLVRYLAGGVMSEWLRNDCSAGCEIEIEGPLGSFGIAATGGPQLMIAGGAGLAPILAMLNSLRASAGPKPPFCCALGATRGMICSMTTNSSCAPSGCRA